MNAKTIGYWVTTAIVSLGMAAGGFAHLTHQPPVAESMSLLQYPMYMSTLLGIWKVLAPVALLAPNFPRLKEWAYAGVIFLTTGAFYSHIAAGDAAGAPPTIVVGVLAMVSWALRPDNRRLA
jgi:uncharacterized membrane protein YphA (DoxX/SURF4 family)